MLGWFMQEALLLPERKPVQAFNVGNIEGWKGRIWSCIGCRAQVFPKACDPTKRFDRVAHFSLKPHARHEDDCTVDGLDRLVEKARRQPISAADKLLSGLPASVTFRDHAVTPSGGGVAAGGGSNLWGAAVHQAPETRWHRASSTSIDRVCRAHASLSDGRLRQAIVLDVEGCSGSNYRDIFHQLQNIPRSGTPPSVAGCIFYADLRLKQSPDYADPDRLVLKLNRGRAVDDRESARFYELIIEWKNWTSQLRESFGKDLEAKRADSWKRFLAARNENRNYRTDLILYFLGSQVESDPFAFKVSDYRKLALITEPNGLFPDSPRWGFVKPELELSASAVFDAAPFVPAPDARVQSSSLVVDSQPLARAAVVSSSANAAPVTADAAQNGSVPVRRSTSGQNTAPNQVSRRVPDSSLQSHFAPQLWEPAAQPRGQSAEPPSRRFRRAFRWIAEILGIA